MTIDVRIPAAPAFSTSGTSPAGVLNYPFSDQITATESGYTITYSASGLPPWLSIDPATGIISGTAQATGTYNASVTADNGYSQASENIAISVGTLLPLDSPSLAVATGAPIAFQLPTDVEVTGSTYALTYTGATLPQGLNLDTATGLLTGTLAEGGTYTGIVYLQTDHSAQSLPITVTASAPLTRMQGSYYSLITTGTCPLKAAGNATFAITTSGAFTGSVLYNGQRIALAGAFDAFGNWTGLAKNNKSAQATLRLGLGASNNWVVTGNITRQPASSVVCSFCAAQELNPANLPSQLKGSYTALIESGSGTAGYGLATISKSGALALTLTLPGGLKAAGSAPVFQAQNGALFTPFFAATSTMSLSGTLCFTSSTNCDASGPLACDLAAKAATRGTPAKPATSTALNLLLAKYTPATPSAALGSGTSFTLAYSGTSVSGSLPWTLPKTTSTVGASPAAPKLLSITFVQSTGAFTGSFKDSASATHSFGGILFEKANTGYGLFSGSTSGAVQLGK